MKTISFGRDQTEIFYKTLQQRVNGYLQTQANDRGANAFFWFKLVFYYAGFVLTYLGIFTTPVASPALLCFWYILCGFFVLGIVFNVAHDAAHGTVFKTKKYNRWLYNLSFPLLGNHPYVWRTYHLKSHHLFTNVEGSDIDVVTNQFIRLSAQEPIRKYHRYQHLYAPVLYLFYTLNFIFLRDVQALLGKTDRTIEVTVPPREKIRYTFSKIFYLSVFLVLPYGLTGFSLGNVLLAFVLMQAFMSLIIILVLSCNHQVDLTAHHHCKDINSSPISWVSLQLQANLDYSTSSRFFHFVVGGFNAHTLHHLFPAVCHVHYRQLVTIMRQTCAEYGIHYNETSYHQALRAHFRFLRKMGQTQPITV